MKTKISVSNFNLTYTGMYHLIWGKNDVRVFLRLSDLLKILKIEGFTIDEFDEQIDSGELLLFSKTELFIDVEIVNEEIESFYTSDFCECGTFGNNELWLIEVKIK